jgi:heterogeneous nuclear ribonucleoprotein A1/A3
MYDNNNDGASNGGAIKKSASAPSSGAEPEHYRKLFIGGLSLATTDESLSQFYSQFGEILDCVVMREPQTKKSRGFGFISFGSKEEVDKAMDARPHEIDGKTVDPKRAVPRESAGKAESNVSTKRLYVSGVREGHTEEIFQTYFSEFGEISKIEIIPDKATGKPRGFAFISFEDYDPVDKCVLQKSHMISGYRCDVKKALSKDEMARASQKDRDREARGARSRGGGTMGGGGGYQQRGSGYGGGGGGYGGGAYGAQWPPQQQAGGWGAAPQQQQWAPQQQAQAYYGGYGDQSAATAGWGGAVAGGQQQPQWSAAPAVASQSWAAPGQQPPQQWASAVPAKKEEPTYWG